MAKENPVFQVLATSGNQSPLAKGNGVASLAPGQIGVFNFHTGLSIDATSSTVEGQEVFIAVGIGSGGVTTDIAKSAGQMIQVRHLNHYTAKQANASVPKIVEVTGFAAKCDTTYGIKIQYSNQQIYGLQGHNQFAKTYTYHTGCCIQEDCNDCPQGDSVELAIGLVNALNKDTDKLITAELIDGAGGSVVNNPEAWAAASLGGVKSTNNLQAGASYTDGVYTDVALTGGAGTGAVATITVENDEVTSVVITDGGQNYVVGNTLTTAASNIGGTGSGFAVTVASIKESTNLGIRITINAPSTPVSAGNVNLGYFHSRETNAVVSLVNGFSCNGTVTVTQELKYEEGNGYDLKQLEYIAGGWNGKPGPYRLSPSTGTEVRGFDYQVNDSTKYHQVVIGYDQESVGGWLEYLNNLETIIGIPVGQTTTLTGLVAILDKIFANKVGPLADDVSGFGGSVVSTSNIDNPNADGIEMTGA